MKQKIAVFFAATLIVAALPLFAETNVMPDAQSVDGHGTYISRDLDRLEGSRPEVAAPRQPADVPAVKFYSLFSPTTPALDLDSVNTYLRGFTSYRIEFVQDLSVLGLSGLSGVVPGASELRFPIKAWFTGARLNWREKLDPAESRGDLVRFTLDWYDCAQAQRGQMRDSDWLDDSVHPGRDIYSESDAKVRGYVIDGRFTYNGMALGDTLFIGPMAGCRYEWFKFTCDNVEQAGYGIYSPYTARAPGRVLEYSIKYLIPYVGLSSDLLLGDRFSLRASGGYAPLTDVRDRDDHVMTLTVSRSHCLGAAVLADFGFNWQLTRHIAFSGNAQYMRLNVSGRQIQSDYSSGEQIVYASLDSQIRSDQLAVSLALAYTF